MPQHVPLHRPRGPTAQRLGIQAEPGHFLRLMATKQENLGHLVRWHGRAKLHQDKRRRANVGVLQMESDLMGAEFNLLALPQCFQLDHQERPLHRH